jgi:hypothetical protein
MIEGKVACKELTARARVAGSWTATAERAYELADEIGNEIERLALAHGISVDDVFAPLIAEQNARQDAATQA